MNVDFGKVFATDITIDIVVLKGVDEGMVLINIKLPMVKF